MNTIFANCDQMRSFEEKADALLKMFAKYNWNALNTLASDDETWVSFLNQSERVSGESGPPNRETPEYC